MLNVEIRKTGGELSVIIRSFSCEDTRLNVVSLARPREVQKWEKALGGGQERNRTGK